LFPAMGNMPVGKGSNVELGIEHELSDSVYTLRNVTWRVYVRDDGASTPVGGKMKGLTPGLVAVGYYYL